MKVDVIIPTHNRAKRVVRAVESVLEQSFELFNLYVVDDGSTDTTASQLKRFQRDPRFHYYQIKHSGVSRARNYGVDRGQAKWLAFLDSDDEWLPDKLARQFEVISQSPELPLIHGEEIWIRNGKRVNPKKYHKKSGGDVFERSLELCLISPSAVVIKRDIYLHYGGFDEDFVVCEDYDLWLKVTSKHQVGFVGDPVLIKHGGHSDQLSRKYVAMDERRVKSMLNLYEKEKLSTEQRSALLKVLRRKCQILELGHTKHSHPERAQYFHQLDEWAKNQQEGS